MKGEDGKKGSRSGVFRAGLSSGGGGRQKELGIGDTALSHGVLPRGKWDGKT